MNNAPTGEQIPSSSIFLRWFLAGLCTSLVALLLLRELPLFQSTLNDPHRRWAMLVMPPDEIVALKLQHARTVPSYDIGLFGNSRIIMVGSEELDLSGRRIFNFAIGGQSIRQSIRLLDALRAAGKAPHTAIISMDHVELGLPGGAGVLPRPPHRWLAAFEDIMHAGQREGLRSAVVQTINSMSEEACSAAITFNHIYVFQKLHALFGLTGPSTRFRADGSTQEHKPRDKIEIPPLPNRADTYPQLENDFARLAGIRDAGVNVIIYESPVAPDLANSADNELSARALSVRQRFRSSCIRLNLVCYDPPSLSGAEWFDRDHAPARPLAAWLRNLVQ